MELDYKYVLVIRDIFVIFIGFSALVWLAGMQLMRLFYEKKKRLVIWVLIDVFSTIAVFACCIYIPIYIISYGGSTWWLFSLIVAIVLYVCIMSKIEDMESMA